MVNALQNKNSNPLKSQDAKITAFNEINHSVNAPLNKQSNSMKSQDAKIKTLNKTNHSSNAPLNEKSNSLKEKSLWLMVRWLLWLFFCEESNTI